MVWIPHADILNIDDFCPSQVFVVMAIHAFTIFVGIMLGFYMGYKATSKILAESWEMLPIFKFNFYLAYIACNVVMVTWPLKIILCITVSSFAGFIAQMIAILANVFLIIALMTTWIARIRIELKDSRYEVSSCVNTTMVVFYAMAVIAAFLGTVGLTVSWTIDSIHLLDESAILILTAGILYLLLSCMFLTIFARTLQAITIQKYMAESMHQLRAQQQQELNGNDNNKSPRVERSQSRSQSNVNVVLDVEIQDKIMKYAGLSLLGLLTSVVSLLFKALVILFEDFEYGIQMVAWVNSVDSLVNFIVLFLQYGFAADYYYFWCKCIDHLFGACMQYKTKQIMRSNHEYVYTDQDEVDDDDADESNPQRPLHHIGGDSSDFNSN